MIFWGVTSLYKMESITLGAFRGFPFPLPLPFAPLMGSQKRWRCSSVGTRLGGIFVGCTVAAAAKGDPNGGQRGKRLQVASIAIERFALITFAITRVTNPGCLRYPTRLESRNAFALPIIRPETSPSPFCILIKLAPIFFYSYLPLPMAYC